MGLVTTATFAVLIPRSPVFLLDYLWDHHSVWGSPNWGMQCKYPETRATWEAVPMWHDVVWRGSSLSFGSGIIILSPLLYQGKHSLLRVECMKPCYLVSLWNCWCITKIKLKSFSWLFLKADQKVLLGIMYIYVSMSTWNIFKFLKFLFFYTLHTAVHNCSAWGQNTT